MVLTERVEGEVLLAEMQHRMLNNLQLVAGLVHMRLRKVEGEEARTQLTSLHEQINALSVVQKMLAEAHEVPVERLLWTLTLMWERLAGERGICVNLEADSGIEISGRAAQSLALVANELVTNALQHGFPNGGPGLVRVRLRRSDSELAMLVVADDGKGMRPPYAGDDSLGLALVQRLAADLGGTVAFEEGELGGTLACLAFSDEADEPRAL